MWAKSGKSSPPFDTLSSPTLGLQVGFNLHDACPRIEFKTESEPPVPVRFVGCVAFAEDRGNVAQGRTTRLPTLRAPTSRVPVDGLHGRLSAVVNTPGSPAMCSLSATLGDERHYRTHVGHLV